MKICVNNYVDINGGYGGGHGSGWLSRTEEKGAYYAFFEKKLVVEDICVDFLSTCHIISSLSW